MKSDIRQNGMWWSWIEKCDKCGKVICTHKTRTTRKPDMEQADFCSECIRYLMDNNIPYEVAKETYKKNA